MYLLISNFDQFCFQNRRKLLSSSVLGRKKEKKMLEYITDGLEISSDDSDQENSNEKKLNIELLAMKMLKNWTFIAYSFQK